MHTHQNYKYNRLILMIGTFLEYYDLMLYVHMASILNELFFDPEVSWLMKYGSAISFCSTFFLKPIGGFVWGWVGDAYGRKKVLVYSLILMGLCSGIITLLPSYKEIGFSAFIVLTICRLFQGFASIGETNASEIYIAENITIPKRYFSTALISYAGVIGTVISLFIVKLVLYFDLNWRFAFLFGTIILFLGLLIRLKFVESNEFLQTKNKLKIFLDIDIKQENAKQQITNRGLTSILHTATNRTKLAYFCVFCGWPISFYFSYVYCGNILQKSFGFTKAMVVHQNLILGLFNLLGLFCWVYLTKFIHPLKILKFKLSLYFPFIFALPYLLTIANSSSFLLLIQVLVILLGNSTVPARGVFIMSFGTLERFKWSAGLNGVSHVLLYIITSFGMDYMNNIIGVYGVLVIFLVITIIYTWGILEFIKIEKENGNYYVNFKK